jgi:poly(A) polymerase
LSHQQRRYPKTLLVRALAGADQRLAEKQPISPAFLFAALLWEPLQEQMHRPQAEGSDEHEALQTAADLVIQAQLRHTALPRRYSLPMREVWELQLRMAFITGKRPLRLFAHPRFRAAYDFLLLRAETDDARAAELADWWTRFLALDEAGRVRATQPAAKEVSNKKDKPRRRRKPRPAHKDGQVIPPTPDA